MRRVYLLLIVIIFIFAFAAGYNAGSDSAAEQLAEVIQKRDSLTNALNSSFERERALAVLAETAKKEYIASDEKVKDLEDSLKQTKVVHGKKIQKVREFTSVQIDSFIVARYPRKLTLNQSLRPITLYEFQVHEIEIDLVKLDSVSAIAHSLDSINHELKESVASRNVFIGIQDEIILEKAGQVSTLQGREQTYIEETLYWKKEDKKHKRQRTGIAVGGVVIVGTLSYLLILK
jgi:hypothetical protein